MNEENKKVYFYQGTTDLLSENKQNGKNEDIKIIKEKIADFSNIKNLNFLLGAGASSEVIPTMEEMKEYLKVDLKGNDNLSALWQEFLSNKNNDLEVLLGIMYAKQYYLKSTAKDAKELDDLIKHIQDFIYKKININLTDDQGEINNQLNLYKSFYQKIVLRNKDLARVNVFTTNNDLFNEKALDDLNINYNNGFGGGLERTFNPARFRYTFSSKIDANLEKFEPLENMVYLYKLHGSISWIEKKGNSLFNIQEITVDGGKEKMVENSVLIYPTFLKQEQSLGSPYADLIREFQTKLCQSNSVLFVIGYSFSDEHINDIIYQSLASNASLSIVIFGEHLKSPLAEINDNRIYRIFGLVDDDDNKIYKMFGLVDDDDSKKIHYFKYIVEKLLPDLDENKEKDILEYFAAEIIKAKK